MRKWHKPINVKNKAIIIVCAIIITLAGVSIYHEIEHHATEVEKLLQKEKKDIYTAVETITDFTYAPYSTRIKTLLSVNNEIVQAFADRDRELLYQLVLSRHKALQQENNYFQLMHFHLPDGRSFLRVHKPELFGDDLKQVRPIIQEVHKRQEQLTGFEIGRLGAFYRVAQPVYRDGEYIGVLEFGTRVKQLGDTLKKQLQSDVAIYFLADRWQKATLLNHHEQRQFGKYALITHDDSIYKQLPYDLDIDQDSQIITIGGKNYIIHSQPVFSDYKGTAIGGILALHDVTSILREKEASIVRILVYFGALLLISFLVLYYSFGQLIGNLEQYRNRQDELIEKLFEEIDERKQAEEALQQHKKGLEELVKERTDELTQANEQLTTSLHEKEVLLKEIHHRVKNNMQVVSSLLKLQARKVEDKEAFQILQDSQNRIRTMALIHENIYRSEDLAKIKFYGYIMDLTTGLFELYKPSTSHISLHVDTSDDSMLDIDTAIPCGLIINELVTNALKYGFPEGKSGEIRILFTQTGEDELTLTVSDNGVGLPEDIDFRKTDSLGLHLVTMLAEDQLDGKIILDRTTGPEFQIRFRQKK